MKKTKLLTVILCCLLLSCQGNTNNTNEVKILDFDTKTTKTTAKDILDIKYIALEYHKDHLLSSDVQQIEHNAKYIYILNTDNSEVVVYNHNGKYIGVIGRNGKAEGEFLYPEFFYMDNTNNRIGVYDYDTEKVSYFSDEYPFDFITSIEPKQSEFYYAVVDDSGNKFSLNSNVNPEDPKSRKHFLVMDEQFNLKNSFNDKEFISGYSMGSTNPIYKVNNDIFGYNLFDNIVYKLTVNSIEPFYKIKFGENTIPPIDFFVNEIGENNHLFFSKLFESNYVSVFYIYETLYNMCILYNVGMDKIKNIGFYDKKTNKTVCYAQSDFADSMQIGTFTNINGIINNSFVMPMEAEAIKIDIEDGKSINKELTELAKKVSNETVILALIDIK